MANQMTFTSDCMRNFCTVTALADFDVAQVTQKTTHLGMTINMLPCAGNSDGRNCLYVAWGDISATNGKGSKDCTNDTAYNCASTCVIMEAC